jgi:hypothetical protein
VAVSKPRAISCELTCSQFSWWSAQNSRENITFYKGKTTAGTGSGCEQAQSHQLWAYELGNKLIITKKFKWKEKKFIKIKTTTGTGSGFEQAQGLHLWAYMLTMKLMVISILMWEKKNDTEKTTAGIGSGFQQAQGHELWAYMLTIKLMVSSKL